MKIQPIKNTGGVSTKTFSKVCFIIFETISKIAPKGFNTAVRKYLILRQKFLQGDKVTMIGFDDGPTGCKKLRNF